MSLRFRAWAAAGEGGVSVKASGGLLVGALRGEHRVGRTAWLGALSRVPLRPGLLQRAAGQAGILAFCPSSPPSSPKLSLCENPLFCQLCVVGSPATCSQEFTAPSPPMRFLRWERRAGP